MRLFAACLFTCLALGCGSGDDGSSKGAASSAQDAGTADATTKTTSSDAAPQGDAYRLHVQGQLVSDEMGARFFAQNRAAVYVAPADIAGKRFIWATTIGGESIANADFIAAGAGTIAEDLSFDITTDPKFVDGPYEFAMVIDVTGSGNPPKEGDLASFSFDNVEPGTPKATGVSIRFNIHGSDAEFTLSNREFIRF